MIPQNPGAVGSLALALFSRWEAKRVFVLVTVYIDESGTHGSPVTILGGWVGRLGQWATFDPKWDRLLKRSGLTHFHSKEMKHTQGEFANWTIMRKREFMDGAAKLALKNLEFGFTVHLRADDYQEHYIAGHRPRKRQLDSAYGLCFRYCLGMIPPFASEAFGERPLDMHFVMESGHKNFGDAERIFKEVKTAQRQADHIQKIIGMLRTLTSADKEDYPGLQAADVNAYSAFQHETRSPVQLVALPNDGTVAHAKKVQKTPIFSLSLGPAELRALKQNVLDDLTEREEYQRQLRATRLASA